MNEIQKALESGCSPLSNPMGATSTMINKKIDQVNEILKQWENADKAADLDKQKKAKETENNTKSSKSEKINKSLSKLDNFTPKSPIEVLSMAGVKVSDLNKIKKIMSVAKKMSDIGKNYGKESNADFVKKVANVQTYLGHKGLTGLNGCNVLNSVFSVSMGLGKALLKSMDGKLGEISGMLNKINGWLDQGLSYGQEIADRIMKEYSDITGMLDNALQVVQDLSNQLNQVINDELNALKEILNYNARMALGSLLGGLVNDPCVKGLIGNIGNKTIKGFFK